MPHENLREALGQVISDQRREWRRERELIEAQARETVAELRARVVELDQLVRTMVEARLSQVKDGDPGKSVSLEDVAPLIGDAVQRAVSAIPGAKDGEPGKDADPELVRVFVADEVKTAVAALPVPKDGQSVTVEDCRQIIEEAVAAAIAALPAARDGKSVTVDDCLPVIQEALRQSVASMPKPKDGKDGKMPTVKLWSDKVHYETEVVVHEGSTFQALRDTARAPPHEDWICIARGGKAGRGFTPRGLFDASAEYAELDVVMLNGASFVSRVDNPGPCPGDGWFLLASQGKQGKPGPIVKGNPGPPGPPVKSMSVNDDGLLAVTNADGSVVTCDLYPLLAKIHN